MHNVVPVYKPIGLTPLQVIHRFKQLKPEYADEVISYAGRLDPMAEGLLLLLVGEENKNRKQYEDLIKTYEFTILLGIETDTYDVLGMIVNSKHEIRNLKQFQNSNEQTVNNIKTNSDFDIRISDLLPTFSGKRIQVYPVYSSKTVKGKPLYWWARQGRLQEITIPAKEVEVYSLEYLSSENISMHDLKFLIQEKIAKVHGDFRQQEILHEWRKFIASTDRQSFPLLHCRVTCSSGTYVRSIAHEFGQKLGCGGIALNIKRTAIGNFSLNDVLM